jgi:hypothetical protein
MVQLMIEDKTSKKVKSTHLAETKVLNNKISAGEVSVWNLDEFPYTYQPFKCTPNALKVMFDDYSLSTKGIHRLCKEHGVREHSVYILIERYSEVRAYYERCLKQRAVVCNEKSVDLWEEPLQDDEFEETKWGKKLNYASVVFRDRKSQMYSRQAALLDRERFGEKQVIESTVKTFSINRNINGDSEAANKSLMDLFNTFSPQK